MTVVKKILIVLSEWGYWGEELVGPLDHFDEAGYESTFVTPRGKKPRPLAPSMDPKHIDLPRGYSVVSPETAKRVHEVDMSGRLDDPINLYEWFPDRPYVSSQHYFDELESYYTALSRVSEEATAYDALLLVGGSGPFVDMVNNFRIHDLILAFYKAGKPIAAECYAVTCLALAREIDLRKSILWGKHVTGHPLEDDWEDGTGFERTDFVIGPPPFVLEYILRDATGPEGGFYGNFGRPVSVVVDYPFITARTARDSYPAGERIVEVLESGLTRYGW
ncbi:MAG TPA: type 1 glutamine amidotransferase domain-containing protein [Pseudonocardiaceae bacterium]|nr:type 1 glutamine amidotransferase domain-containing protein [Pseudonocardiaceae bacterium]